MYCKEMSAAVNAAQKRLMETTDSRSTLTSIASDLTDLNALVIKLDPSNINFDKGGLEKLKITNYWNKFEKYYPEIKQLFEKLTRSKRVLFNSKTTINRYFQEFVSVYDEFRATPDEARDEEYIQQAIVSENAYQLLKSSVDEHETVYKHLNSVIELLETSLDIAIYLARKSANRNIAGTKNTIIKNITDSDYQQQFTRLTAILQ